MVVGFIGAGNMGGAYINALNKELYFYETNKERIKELCEKKKMNLSRLATISGIPYTTIKSIIYGQSKNPGITTIKKICDGLEISVTDFFDTETFKNLEQEIK